VIAQQLARDVAASTASRRTWRKVTTLLELFGVYRLTSAVRERIADALDEAGLVTDPSFRDVERYGSVALALRDQARAPVSAAGAGSGSDAIHATAWRAGQRPVEIGAAARAPADALLWIDVDISKVDDPGRLHRVLSSLCGDQLTDRMVAELLEVDPQPRTTTVAPGIRNVTSFAVATRESELDPSDPEASKAGALVFQPVEFVAAERWIMSCWHKRRATTDGTQEGGEEDPADRAELIEHVADRWVGRDDRCTAGDLGVMVLHELAHSYTGARRVLWAWHESWELDFYEQRHRTERETLRQLRGQIKAFSQRLESLNQPGMSRNPKLIWFDHVTDHEEAERVDDLIDRALADLRALTDVLRTSTDLFATEAFSHQSRQTERFQELASAVAAVLLVPTLVVGFFGANTRIPGQGSWAGLGYMTAAMIVSAIVTYLVIRWRRAGED
jgi:hypothetical protein